MESMVSIKKDMTIIIAYVINAVKAPTCMFPASILCAPTHTIPMESRFISIIIPGIMNVMTRLVNNMVFVRLRFASSNRSSSFSSRPNARMTERPVKISLDTRLILSTNFCISLNFGMAIEFKIMI